MLAFSSCDDHVRKHCEIKSGFELSVFGHLFKNDMEAVDETMLCFVVTQRGKLRYLMDDLEIAFFDVSNVFGCDFSRNLLVLHWCFWSSGHNGWLNSKFIAAYANKALCSDPEYKTFRCIIPDGIRTLCTTHQLEGDHYSRYNVFYLT